MTIDSNSGDNNNGGVAVADKDSGDALYSELWHACAGPLVTVPRQGELVFYFPQGHIEQVEASTNQVADQQMPTYDLPWKILCRVVNVQLKAEPDTDEVFAQITLLPESEVNQGDTFFKVVGVSLSVPKSLLLETRGETGELRVGVRRAMRQESNIPSSVMSSHSMHIGILATAWHAVSTRTLLTVYYKPRTSPAEFIIPVDKYMESVKNNYSIGMRFEMRFEAEEAPEQRFSGTVIGVEHADPKRWPGSKWRCLKVHWDKTSPLHRPESVSPWEVEPALTQAMDPLPTCRVTRLRSNMATLSTDSAVVAKKDNGLSRDRKDQEIPSLRSTFFVNNYSDAVQYPT